MKPIVEIKNLHNRFGRHVVHDGLDFAVYPGEIVGLVGGTGAGKTVLLKSIIGLHRPKSGTVTINGKNIMRMNKAQVLATQRLWGVLFQNGALFSSLNVRDNVAMPIKEFIAVNEEQAQELAEMKIELVGLPPEARDKLPSELSGGMVRRAALARALALDPKILFLDEPTSGLDPISASMFDDLIRKMAKNLGLTVMIITHDLDTLFSTCDRIAVMVDKKIKTGTLKEHLKDKHPWIHDYFHGPRARAVLAAKNVH